MKSKSKLNWLFGLAVGATLMAAPVKAMADWDNFHPRANYQMQMRENHRFGFDRARDRDDFRRFRPSYFNGQNYGLIQSRNQYVYARDSARAQYYAAVARGDRDGARHLFNAWQARERDVVSLNARIGF